jgi:hypothetical protein
MRSRIFSFLALALVGCHFEASNYGGAAQDPAPAESATEAPPAPPAAAIPALHGIAAGGDRAFAVGDAATVLRVGATGDAVAEIVTDSTADLAGVWAANAQEAYAVGKDGAILHRDAGGNWTPQASGVKAYLASVWGASPVDVYAVGSDGTILHSSNHGVTWKPQKSGTKEYLVTVWGTDPADVWVGGYDGSILHSVDGGATWTKTASGLKSVSSFWGTGPSDIWGAGCMKTGSGEAVVGAVAHTVDRGHAWSKSKIDGSGQLFGLTGSGTTRIGVGVGGALVRADEGESFHVLHDTEIGQTILFSTTALPNGVLFAVGEQSLLVRSIDGGVTFQRVSVATPAASKPMEI